MHELLAFQVWDTFRVAGMLMRHLMARNTIKILEPGQSIGVYHVPPD